MKNLLMALMGLVWVTGCASIPRPLEGDYPNFYPDQVTDRSMGAKVRWGGTILETEPASDQTCMEIMARELDRSYRPVHSDQSRGRFLACRSGFQDPAIFSRGREVTVIGRLDEQLSGQIGEFEYLYPVLSSEILYLWPEQPQQVYVHPHPGYFGWYDPWWGPYPRYPYGSRSRFSSSILITR